MKNVYFMEIFHLSEIETLDDLHYLPGFGLYDAGNAHTALQVYKRNFNFFKNFDN